MDELGSPVGKCAKRGGDPLPVAVVPCGLGHTFFFPMIGNVLLGYGTALSVPGQDRRGGWGRVVAGPRTM